MKVWNKKSMMALCLGVVTSLALMAPASAAPDFAIKGYATVSGSTTGGTGGTTVTVSDLASLKNYGTASGKYIIKVNGVINLSGQVDITSNKTVVGVGKNSGLTGGGLRVKNSSNVIIQNLNISKATGTDAITVQASNHVWVDHNDLSSDLSHDKDYYDGLLDISHGSDYVTASWNKFHDHFKTSLVGHSDNNASEDTGKFHVTYHHNSFVNTNSRLPSLRFGTGHIYNNYYENAETGVNSRIGAQVLVEGNYFNNVKTPIMTTKTKGIDGYVVERNNVYVSSGANTIGQVGSLTSVPYTYNLDSANTLQSTIAQYGGTGVVNP
ncbi:polysaccharide lyase family 1 protein [Paenibacillus nicotianae]|uniref:Polysaccharide lyase family 1 protein n=1 Tax=Paenibacillus nicotianae TaxID=1526551 RepID=A0ABW4UY60_9BACL